MIANASREYSGSSRRRIARRGLFVAIGALVLAVGLAAPAQAKGGGGGNGGGNGGGGGNGAVNPTLVSVTFTPSPVIGGGGVTATAGFAEAASQGAVVDVTSSDPTVASVQALGSDPTVANATAETVAVPGSSTAKFGIETTPVAEPTTVTITAHDLGGATVSADLTIVPGTPPAPDTLKITKAEYKQGLLSIEATDSNPNALVNFFVPSFNELGEALTNEGGGRYSYQQIFDEVPPIQITLVSNFGGEATAEAGD